MAARRTVGVTPPALIFRLLNAAGEDEVLVGGQALGVWVAKYDLAVPADRIAITRDTDFLTQSPTARSSVEKFARAIGGKARYPRRLERTALVGQVDLDISDDEFINVDVVFRVVGLDPQRVKERALRVDMHGVSFLVMHPFDVLRSRLANLHELNAKQNEKGVMQLTLAIQVARQFLRSESARFSAADTSAGRSPVQTLVSEIEKMAIDDAARKVADRWGLHVADVIDPTLIPAGPFWTKKWPTLRAIMSDAYARQFVPPPDSGELASELAK